MGIFGREPAAIAGAVQAIFAMCVGLGWLHLTDQQIALILFALTAVLTLFVRQSVVPVQLGRERQAEGKDPMVSRNS